MADIKVYNGNPTAGGTDGSVVSEDEAQTNPIKVTLNKTNSESACVKLAARCDSGKKVSGNLTITSTGTTASKWTLCVDNSYADAAAALAGGTFTSSITLSNVAAANVIFWAKATSSTDDSVSNDTAAVITATGEIVAA